MLARHLSFALGERTIHAVVLRQHSKFRWNAFLWGAGLSFAHTFARRAAAERWLVRLLRMRFPEFTLGPVSGFTESPSSKPHVSRLHRDATYRA